MTLPLLTPIAGNLLGRFRIRKATPADVAACDRIARAYKSELGFVRRDKLTKSASKGLLHVGEIDGVVRGFVEYNTPTRGANRGYSVVYHLATERGWGGYGIGRNLLYSVPTPIRLKCTVDNSTANTFYAGAGMRLTATEPGKKRALNVWELRILPILVQGTNRQMPRVARASGMAYGTREIEIPREWVYQVDIDLAAAEGDWRRYEWGRYLRKIQQWRPAAALVVDYFEPDQKATMLRQIEDLKGLGVLNILVCPKFEGAVKDIPQDCIVAISIPSTYAGYVPPLHELTGRRVHLLGGTPVQWFGQKGKRRNKSATGYVAMFQGAGATVVSVDGNSHTGLAEQGGWWASGVSNFDRNPFCLYDLAILSGRNIVRDLNMAAGGGQLPLFAA
jgi:hypothetical protein